jgi:hypothetical protein
MKNYKLKITAVMVFVSAMNMNAQNTTVASGGNALGAGGTVNYSIGQMADKTQTGTTGTITQGVQQPFEIVTLSGTDFTHIRLEAIIYPNPTITNVTLKISESNLENLNYQLFDIQSRLITEGKISNQETIFDMQRYSASTYILKVNSNSKELKTFKIIKN